MDTAQPAATTQDIVAKTKAYLQEKSAVPAAKSPATAKQPVAQVANVKGMASLIDAVFAKGIIDDQALRSVKFESITSNKPAEQILLSRGLANEDQIQQTKAEMQGMGYIELSAITIENKVISKLPKEIAARNRAVVFEETPSKVRVAMVDPLDLQKVKFLESLVGKSVEAYYATESAIQRTIDTRYGAQLGKEVDQALADVGVLDLATATSNLKVEDLANKDLDDSAPVAKIVNMILDYAIKHEASDVHIEPRETRIAVRFRIHGILMEKLTIPAKLASAVVSRIKILANMKIDEHRVPQDNRFQVKTADKLVDLRVSVMPNIYGEKVVIRLLEKDSGIVPLEQTGLRGPAYKLYRDALSKTQGIILITGPTGSGKTVTLASSLAILNKQEVNIVTIEDPVEIRIDGVTQVQVNPEVGLTFATGLRSFLRQDPDIIMVGEIRDSETADLAIQSSLVGRLVLATLHTNSAAGALPRLLDMGVQPFLLASTINIIGAQRLVRRLCDDCKQPYDAEPHVVEMLHRTLDGLNGFDLYSYPKSEKIHFDRKTDKVKLYKPVGCPKCGDTGYSGRLGIFEVMAMNDKIGQMVMSHLSANEIQKQAVADGMITMVQDGYMKVLEGTTTIEEVLRVQNT